MLKKQSSTEINGIPVGDQTKTNSSMKYFLLLYGGIQGLSLLQLIDTLNTIEYPKEDVEIDFVITSAGGDAHTAFQMVRVIREKCAILRGIVPLFAKSAATLLVLGSDQILMAPQSELGPLDVQIEHPSEGRFISALDHVGSVEYVSGFALNLANKAGLWLRREVGLSRIDSVKIGLDFASVYIEQLVSQLDPSLLTQSYRSLEVAEEYAVKLLQEYMFCNQIIPLSKIQEMASALVWKYQTHGFVIDIREAMQLGLNVLPDRDYPFRETVWSITKSLLEKNEDFIKILRQDDILEAARINNGKDIIEKSLKEKDND
jgi:hypothetical protein